MINLYKLFPSKNFKPVERIVRLAFELSCTHKNKSFLIDHIIYGYMRFIELDVSSEHEKYIQFPWYTDSSVYLSAINFEKFEKRGSREKYPTISEEILYLSKQYNKYLSEMNMETFYYLLFSLNVHDWNTNYIIPIGDCESMNILLSSEFSQFIRTNHSHMYLKNSKEGKNVSKPLAQPFCVEAFYADPMLKEKPASESPYKVSLNFEKTIDITNNAYRKKYPKIIGREFELNRLIDILSKMNRNNAILIGESGVGKTAIVHELANLIVNNHVPNTLKNCHILELDITSIIAGSKYRGDFEKRVRDLIHNIETSVENIILYIDNIHLAVGLGSCEESSFSFTDMLKPLLQGNSNVKIIGTSTFKDYKKVEFDKTFERLFDTITVSQPTFEQTLKILKSIKYRFEDYYSVTIHDDTLENIISLSERYIPERFLPDKAIDVLDETCAIKNNSDNSEKVVLPSDVLVCISRKKNIPISKIKKAHSLKDLSDYLSSRVVGQKHVIDIIVHSIFRAQANLNDENKPIASFMFIGPTGVGKTEIAKVLSDVMFDNSESFIRFDMSEYMESHSISKLIGSPPGYVGYEEAGLLTEKVRRHPYSLVLFDEFEKAHPKICNLLLQILDEGYLTDSHGDRINFKNTIIILTSNIGIKQLSHKSVGFIEDVTSKSKDVYSEVKKKLPPEFLNRLDEIVQFNELSLEDIYAITKICISNDIAPKLKQKNISITISDSVIEKIARLGYSREYGARELKRTIMHELKNPLADCLLQNNDVRNISIQLIEGDISILPK